MSQTKKMTVPEWNELEADKRVALNVAIQRLETLQARRDDLLLSLGEGKSDKKEFESVEKEISDSKTEIEATISVMTAIPKRRALAQADEAEAQINEIEALKAEAIQLTLQVDADIERFVISLKSVFDVLEKIHEMNPDFLQTILYVDHGIADSIGIALRKHGLWKYVKFGIFRHPVSMSEFYSSGKAHALRGINGLLFRMREAVEKIRAGAKPDMCPNCYGNLVYSVPGESRRVCIKCGQHVEGES